MGGSVLAQETVKKWGYNLFKENEVPFAWGTGASWVFNVQAGYLAYHVLFKRNKRWLVWVVSGWAVVGDVGSWLRDDEKTNHYAHLEGFVVGVAAAFLLDFFFKKRKALF